jgi:DNA repair protein RAD57
MLATADVLLSSTSDLQKRLRLPNLESVNDFVLSVSRGVVPPTRPMDELAEEELEEGCWIGTGDSEVDMALGGGLRLGTITEIAGER